MDDPVRDITSVVHILTQGTPDQQAQAVNTYFTTDASFTHPVCRTGSFEGSKHLIHCIFRWYKILSPTIHIKVNSVAFDEINLILYVNISQVFAIWFIPFHRAPVTLTTVLHLVRKPLPPFIASSSDRYYITSQNDLYQTDQFARIVAPWGVGSVFIQICQYLATLCCVILAYLGRPFTWYMQRREYRKIEAQQRRIRRGGWQD